MEAVRRKFNHTVPNGTASCSIQLDCSDWVAVAPVMRGCRFYQIRGTLFDAANWDSTLSLIPALAGTTGTSEALFS
jgi:hypothetical protein